MKNKAVGIIGFGNMGSSIAQGLKSRYPLFVFDKDKNKTKDAQGIKALDSLADLAVQADILLLAVKPQDFDGVLTELKDKTAGKLIISIAAGITTSYIEKQLPRTRVVRAMPNIGVKIGQSVTCLCAGALATGNDLACARELCGYLGTVLEIKETMMDAATAISGSGPGYEYDDFASKNISAANITEDLKNNHIKRLAEAAEDRGFSKDKAMFLAVNTSNATISIMKELDLKPSELCRQVASQGGTTEAGLKEIHRGGSWKDAARAAENRAKELSRG